MYETTGGQWIDGKVIRRYEHTMSVLGSDGSTHLCRLIGEGEAIKGRGFNLPFEKKPLSKRERPDNSKAIRVIEPNGRIRDFRTINETAIYYGTTRQQIAHFKNKEGPVTRGRYKGHEFVRILEG